MTCVVAILVASATQAYAGFDLLCGQTRDDGTPRPEARLIINDEGSVSLFDFDREVGSYLPMDETVGGTIHEITEDAIVIDLRGVGLEVGKSTRLRIDRVTGFATMTVSGEATSRDKMLCRQTVRAF